ncbi:MAG: TrkA family potassium uptake protein, partial [Natronomonas sp.]
MRALHDIKGLHPRDLTHRQRLLLAYVGSLTSIILVYTIIYHWGMGAIEGRPQSFFRSFQTVVETLTTTGYGADS